MASDYQKTVLVGNVGKAPEMRYTPSGSAVTSFSVAVNSQYNDTKVTTWFRISVWGKLAEVCNQYVTKGMKVLCEGELQPDKETGGPRVWGDPARASFELNASTVRFLSGGKKNDESQQNTEESDPFA